MKKSIVGESKASMNPYDEQRLRDEVIYLHSLWHQGPPQQPIHSSSSSQLQPLLLRRPFAPYHTRSLPPVTTTAFKKTKNHNRKKKKESKPDSLEWRRPQSSNSPQIGWPEPKPRSDPPPIQPQEKERLSALQAQNKACIALKEFLSGSGYGSGDEDDDNEEDHYDDDDDSDARLVEFEEFFIRVFLEDNELIEYYQSCFENGEFCCLVCDAGKKSGKKYKNCIGLVQHSISILRTANKKAHRAFGQAVCKVLGWDIHRLPTIVITAEPLRCSTEGKKSVAADDDGKDGSSQKEDIAVSLELVADSVEEHVKETNQSIGDCSSKENGEGGAKFEEKVVSLAHDDEPVEDDEQGVDQSNSEVIKL